MYTLFIDTNILLQCKKLEEIPWGEKFTDKVVLLVSRPVQEEIDNLKQSGNNRRAKRARQANTLCRRILEEGKVIIKGKNPYVEIKFSPYSNKENFTEYDLNQSRNDDRIVLEALNYRRDQQDTGVFLLTHDTGPIITARHAQLEYIQVPDEWLLDPEPDQRDKKIAQLESKVSEYEKTMPQIQVKAFYNGEEVKDILTIELPKYRELTSNEIEELLKKVQYKHPLKADFSEEKVAPRESQSAKHLASSLNNLSYVPPEEEKIQEYIKTLYPEWVVNVRQLFSLLHTSLNQKCRNCEIILHLNNTGNVPAENFEIEFISNNALIIPPDFKYVDDSEYPWRLNISLPDPPKPPSGKWIDNSLFSRTLADMANMSNMFPLTSALNYIPSSLAAMSRDNYHDKHAFYWKPNKPRIKKKHWILECEEYRHQLEPEIYSINLHFPSDFSSDGTKISCIGTAKNLQKPYRQDFAINIRQIDRDTFEYAKKLIN